MTVYLISVCYKNLLIGQALSALYCGHKYILLRFGGEHCYENVNTTTTELIDNNLLIDKDNCTCRPSSDSSYKKVSDCIYADLGNISSVSACLIIKY